MTGRVHSVETLGTLEGPGLRYVVFLQGCPLRCLYCHNPDTWDAKTGFEKNVDELVAEAKRYDSFIRSSGGGVTCTGGEPLMQAAFVADFFEKLHDNNFHTALDTSGYTDLTDDVRRAVAATDLVLLDIKHVDSRAHKRLTGVSNERISAFARHVDESGARIWVRHVLVPQYTLLPEVSEAVAAFVATLRSVDRVDLLPYHELGKHKWEALGKRYPLTKISPPPREDVLAAWQIFRDAGLPVTEP